MPDTVLLIDDDDVIRRKVTDACEAIGAACRCVASVEDAERCLQQEMPNLVLCDYAAFNAVHDRFPRLCALLFTEVTDSQQAIEAIKRGALDYLVRPIQPEALKQHIAEALRISHDVLVPTVYEPRQRDRAVDEIIGQSQAMKEVYKRIGLIAPQEINVLITGESGTGKELVARAIIQHSPRKDKPFLAVNCAAIPETLLESELFGHEKGAFTGAEATRIGKFEQCDGGTLFLDEIGDIPLPTQAKLLRVLQDNSFQRLGGTRTIRADVRIIAATHQPLEQLIAERRFRQDLFYRINVATIHVPPVREREIDAVLLAHYFVHRYNPAFGTTIQHFAPETLGILLRYRWPGNVRELENAVKAALVVARGAVFRPEFLPERIQHDARETPPSAGSPPDVAPPARHDLARLADQLAEKPDLAGRLFEEAAAMMEREIIRACLERTNGRIAPAARMLGITRATLRNKLARLGLQIQTRLET